MWHENVKLKEDIWLKKGCNHLYLAVYGDVFEPFIQIYRFEISSADAWLNCTKKKQNILSAK